MNREKRLKTFISYLKEGASLINKEVDSGYSPADINILSQEWAREQNAEFYNWIDLTESPKHQPDMSKDKIITGVVYFLGASGDWCPLLNYFAKNKITKKHKLVVPVIIYPGTNSGKETHYCCMAFDFKPETDSVDILLLEQHAMLDKSEKGYIEKLDYSEVIDFNLNNFAIYCEKILGYTNIHVFKNKQPISRINRVCGVVASETARNLLAAPNTLDIVNSPMSLSSEEIAKLHERNKKIVSKYVIKDATNELKNDSQGNIINLQKQNNQTHY